MSDTQNDKEHAVKRRLQSTSGHLPDQAVYMYESAGIAERDGHVPAWLWIVVVSLLIWGLYYLVTYWNAPIVQ
jgi:hypothetical protein